MLQIIFCSDLRLTFVFFLLQQLMPEVDLDGWHVNTLFGVQNELYESSE